MLAYFFRVLDSKDKPTGYVGLVIGTTQRECFWGIDCATDPYSVDVISAYQGGICFLEPKPEYDENGIECEVHDENEEYEVIGGFPSAWKNDLGWRKPKWVTDPNFTSSYANTWKQTKNG